MSETNDHCVILDIVIATSGGIARRVLSKRKLLFTVSLSDKLSVKCIEFLIQSSCNNIDINLDDFHICNQATKF